MKQVTIEAGHDHPQSHETGTDLAPHGETEPSRLGNDDTHERTSLQVCARGEREKRPV